MSALFNPFFFKCLLDFGQFVLEFYIYFDMQSQKKLNLNKQNKPNVHN